MSIIDSVKCILKNENDVSTSMSWYQRVTYDEKTGFLEKRHVAWDYQWTSFTRILLLTWINFNASMDN